MKNSTFILFILLAVFKLQAQDYIISFSGSGASNSVETVKVENLTQGKSVTLNGTDVLHLLATVTGMNPVIDNEGKYLLIYPNPITESSAIEFMAIASGIATIVMFDITGKVVCQAQSILLAGTNSFIVSGLNTGTYVINITSRAYSYAGKLVSNGKSNSGVKITNPSLKTLMKLKSAKAETVMQYSTGDRLKFTGTSGIYCTIITDVPTNNKIITFTFVACTDADGNNYPVVKIGFKTWMAENLETTKYNDGIDIPLVLWIDDWHRLTTPGYCWYNNDVQTYKDTYGALYNWYAVFTGKLSPIGWHVANISDWSNLIDNCGNNDFAKDVAGGMLKETGIDHWVSPNLDASDVFGFTCLPGGSRDGNSSFGGIRMVGNWWIKTTEYGFMYDAFSLLGNEKAAILGICGKNYGLSVRCVKD